jgi:hypothetical protein
MFTTPVEDGSTEGASGDGPARETPRGLPPAVPRCSYCRQPFAADEDHLVQMRGGEIVAVFHDRCHPNYRRSGCAGC